MSRSTYACHDGCKIDRDEALALERFRDFARRHLLRKTFDDGRLADSGRSDEQRVVPVRFVLESAISPCSITVRLRREQRPNGLTYLLRLDRISMTRLVSSALPTTGSSFPSLARAVKSTPWSLSA